VDEREPLSVESNNLLYRKPWLYELVYPRAEIEAVEVCLNVIKGHGSSGSLRILDVGCGTGSALARLSKLGYRGTGLDISESMLAHASAQHPELDFEHGDMRTLDLKEHFDVITCLGSTFLYNLSNDEVDACLSSFRRHCHEGSLLILDILNASRFLNSTSFRERTQTAVDKQGFRAVASACHMIDRRTQRFRRKRTWKIEGEEKPVVDDCQYRLFFPLELEYFLSRHCFSALGMWDNKELVESDLSGPRLYVAARAV
jgi:SAM-dependent methyltransferase